MASKNASLIAQPQPLTKIVYLSLGSNQGDRIGNLHKAVEAIDNQVGKVLEISSYYETEPWGFTDNTNFINQVAKIQSNLSAEQILKVTQSIEQQLGRKRIVSNQRYSSRKIDIDILFADDLVINTENLTIPHLHIHKRNFVLLPMSEISPEFVHPIMKKTISQLCKECDDTMEAKIFTNY